MTANDHSTMPGFGRNGLRVLRQAVMRELPDHAPALLQEIGFASGEDMYAEFERWLPGFAGVDDAADLEAGTLSEVLSAFFQFVGWGALAVGQMGTSGLELRAEDWVEADPAAVMPFPSCFVTAGLLSDFLSRLAGGPAASVMEVECRSQGDQECRFVAGSPETVQAAYEAISAGGDVEAAFRR